jgi:hypothetical protein
MKASRNKASGRIQDDSSHKTGQVSVRTMSPNDVNLPMILGVCQERQTAPCWWKSQAPETNKQT